MATVPSLSAERPRTVRAAQLALAIAASAAIVLRTLEWPSAPPPLAVTPKLAVAAGTIDLTVAITPTANDVLRAWFFLADPDEPFPWLQHDFESPALERRVRANQESVLRWQEPLDLPPGEYLVTIWIHHFDRGEWLHVDGGTFGLEPVHIE